MVESTTLLKKLYFRYNKPYLIMSDLSSILKKLIPEKKSDFYIFRAEITDSTVDKFIYLSRDKKDKQPICSLILTTNGGDPDAGYRLVRFINHYYSKFVLYVFGSCKSTGTLIALGANEIIMSDFGEFGPLDIQLTRDDELSSTSGLNYFKSLDSLNQQIFQSFEQSFMNLKKGSGNTITTRTAGEIASKLAIGLISPISAQIEPIKLGEVTRAMDIADAYGSRITENHDLIIKLITEYPSHSFVIDYKEAKELFSNVRLTDDDEKIFERVIIKMVRSQPSAREKAMILDLSGIIEEDTDQDESSQTIEETTENNSNDETVTHNTNENVNFEKNGVQNEHSGINGDGEK